MVSLEHLLHTIEGKRNPFTRCYEGDSSPKRLLQTQEGRPPGSALRMLFA